MRGYVDNPDVEVVVLVDPSEERRAQRQADWPDAQMFASAADLAEVEVDQSDPKGRSAGPTTVPGVKVAGMRTTPCRVGLRS